MLIGYKIKKLRELKNYTQDFVAEKLEMSQSNYSRIEKNEIDLPFSKLEQIANILDIKINDLIDFDSNCIFNAINNKSVMAYTTIHGDFKATSDIEKKLHEQEIEHLKKEIESLKEDNHYLKKILEEVLSKK